MCCTPDRSRSPDRITRSPTTTANRSPSSARILPLLIGGGGRRVLSIAARHADIVGINGTMAAGSIGPEALSTMTYETVADRVAVVRRAAEERLGEIELNIRAFFVSVTEDASAVIDQMAAWVKVDPELIAASPFALVGTVNESPKRWCAAVRSSASAT